MRLKGSNPLLSPRQYKLGGTISSHFFRVAAEADNLSGLSFDQITLTCPQCVWWSRLFGHPSESYI